MQRHLVQDADQHVQRGPGALRDRADDLHAGVRVSPRAEREDLCRGRLRQLRRKDGQEESFDVGSTYPCWYDPADPATVVLVRHFHPIYYGIAVVPLLFLLIGGNFLWLALGPKAKIKIADAGQGDILAVRLAPDMSPGTALPRWLCSSSCAARACSARSPGS